MVIARILETVETASHQHIHEPKFISRLYRNFSILAYTTSDRIKPAEPIVGRILEKTEDQLVR
jgi:hypothetical protein